MDIRHEISTRFSHFLYDQNEKQFVWQAAIYIEDGTYISSKDLKSFTVWEIPTYGGEPYKRYETDDFIDALKNAERYS